MKKVKVYLWKKGNEISAFTINKDYKIKFDLTRNLNFYDSVGYMEITKEKFKYFQSKYYTKMIFLNPLYHKGEYINTPTTYEEDDILNERCESISKITNEIKTHKNIYFKKKYQKALDEILEISKITDINGKKENLYTFDTFAIFTKIFSDRF